MLYRPFFAFVVEYFNSTLHSTLPSTETEYVWPNAQPRCTRGLN